MYKVFIADDEIGIRKLLLHIIDWERLKMTSIGNADNGITALEQILHLHPDIVITDIEMYGLNGLSLIQKVQEKLPSVHFIIISGYQYFEYAHTAIKYGVDDFLLKPLQKNEINDVLEKIAHKLKSETDASARASGPPVSVMGDSMAQLKNSFFSLMDDNASFPLSEINRKFHFNFQPGKFRFLMLQLDCRDVRRTFMEHLVSNIKKQIQPEYQRICFDCYIFTTYNTLSLLLNYGEENRETLLSVCDKAFRITQNLIHAYKIIHVTMSVGIEVSDSSLLADSYHSQKLCNRSRLRLGTDRILHADQIIPAGAAPMKLPLFDYSQAEKAIELLNPQMVSASLEYQIKKSIPCLDQYPYCVQDIASALFVSYAEIVKKLFPSARLTSEKNFLEQIPAMFRETDVWKFLSETIQAWISAIETERQKDAWKTLKDAKNYIQKNYSQKIGINEVADELFMSPSYFSALFKKETGVNFHDYLLSVRIGEAKKLLKQKRYTVQEISAKVGYHDSKHFSRLFKREVGLNPTEYRKIHWLYDLNLEDGENE